MSLSKQELRQPRSRGKSKGMFKLLLLMLLLLSLTLCLSRAAWSEAKITPVPQGWTSPEPGYWMNMRDGSDLLIGWKRDKTQRDIYKDGLDKAQVKTQELKDVVTKEFADLKAANEADRKAWRAQLLRARAPGLGVFAGGGYDFNSQKIELVVGAGLVWKLW